MPTYPKEELLELYQLLPKDLQEAIHSEEIAQKISNICNGNNITDDEQISQIVILVGHVLLGVLPPSELKQSLEKEIIAEGETAERVAWGINQSIFLELKNSLEALYQIKIVSQSPPPQSASPKKTTKAPKGKPKKADPYREPVE